MGKLKRNNFPVCHNLKTEQLKNLKAYNNDTEPETGIDSDSLLLV